MKTFKKVLFTLVFIAIIAVGLSACKKDKPTPPPTPVVTAEEAKAALNEHYKETLKKEGFTLTADIELVGEIKGLAVTWKSSHPETVTETGKVTRPTFNEGDKTVILTATVATEPPTEVKFFVAVPKLEATTEEKIQAQLDKVVEFPVSSSGYQEVDLVLVKDVEIDGNKVEVVWESTDEKRISLNGKVVPGPEEATVTLTATITYEGVSLSKSATFKTKKIEKIYANFQALKDDDGFSKDNQKIKVAITNVSVYAVTKADYYLADQNGDLLMAHADLPKDVVKGKLYTVYLNTDVYYGGAQVKDVIFEETGDGENTVTPVAKTIAEITALPAPSNDNIYFATPYKVTDSKAKVTKPNDNYGTFLAQKNLKPKDKLAMGNAIMVYYHSHRDVVETLDGYEFAGINIIVKGVRTDKGFWYADFTETANEIDFGFATDVEYINLLEALVKGSVEDVYPVAADVKLIGDMQGVTVKWASDNEEVFNPTTGKVKPGTTATLVTLTVTLTKGTETKDVVIKTTVGLPEPTDVATVLGASVGDFVHVKGVVNSGSHYNAGFIQDAAGKTIVVSAKDPKTIEAQYGKVVTVYGKRGVDYYGNTTINMMGLNPAEGEIEIKVLDGATLAKLDKATLTPHAGANVKLNELKVLKVDVNEKYDNVQVDLETPNRETISIYYDGRTELPEAVVNKIKAMEVGKYYNLTATICFTKNGVLVYTSSSVIEAVTEVSDATKVARIKAEIKALDGQVVYSGDPIVQPETDSEFGVKLNFSITPLTAVNMSDPQNLKWAEVSEETAVIVTATFKVGEIEETQDITLTLVKKPVIVTQTATIQTLNSSSAISDPAVNYAGDYGLDATKFEVKIEANGTLGLGNYGDLRLYGRKEGNGATLIIKAIDPEVKITSIVLDFAPGSNKPDKLTVTIDGVDTVIANPESKVETIDNLKATEIKLFNNAEAAKNPQVRFNKITITYEEPQATPTEFTVTFDGNGNTAGTVPAVQTVAENGNATAPTGVDLVKDTQNFAHWSTTQDDSAGAFDFANTPITENITLYAIYA